MAIEAPIGSPVGSHDPLVERDAPGVERDKRAVERDARGVERDRPGGMSLTVLFDSGCGVCCETVRRLRRWDRDGRMEFLPLKSAAGSGRPILERLAAEGHLGDEIHVVNEATGEVVSGGHAALAVLDALPGGWLLRPWSALAPAAMAADVVYRVASRHRDRVAWLMGMRNEVSCPVAPAAGANEPDR